MFLTALAAADVSVTLNRHTGPFSGFALISESKKSQYGHRARLGATDVKLAQNDVVSVCIGNAFHVSRNPLSWQKFFTHLIASESISWAVYTEIFKEGCSEEDMSSFELFMMSLSHSFLFIMDVEHTFSKSLWQLFSGKI